MEPDGGAAEMEGDEMAVIPDHGNGGQRVPHGGDGGMIAPAAEVEYSVTCQRGKVKTLMDHLVDAAMLESAEWAAEYDPVTISLRLKV